MDVTDALGANLKRVRAASGLSQDAVSQAAELHRTAVSEIEAGNSDARFSTLLKLAGVLGVDPSEFFKGARYKPATTERGGFELPD